MDIHLSVVATSAATALVATLAIEYFAKPRLEARKEEILELYRWQRELRRLIVEITSAAQVVAVAIPNDATGPVRAALQDEQRRRFEALETMSQTLVDDMAKYADGWPTQWREAIVDYAFCVSGLMMSPRDERQKAEIIASMGHPMAILLSRKMRYVFRLQDARIRLAEITASTRRDAGEVEQDPA